MNGGRFGPSIQDVIQDVRQNANYWKRVSVADMNELAETMIASANAHGANIDELKINTLKNLCGVYLRTYNKKKCP